MANKTVVNQSDLKFYPSERMTDNEDGGGMPLGTPLSSEPNAVFQPIPNIARLNGAFYARLVYMGILRPDDAPLYGAYAAITEPPKDPTTSYLLFKSSQFGELRKDIINRVESHKIGTIESRMTLLSLNPADSNLFQAYQRVEEPLPMVGDVYCLRQKIAGEPEIEQYVRLTRVRTEIRTFLDRATDREFERAVIKMNISDKLKADFIGVNYPNQGYVNANCKILESSVADAAQYYGVKPLTAAIEKATRKIKVTEMMEKLAPTNQTSIALADITAGGTKAAFFDSSNSVIEIDIRQNVKKGYLGNAVYPNSLILSASQGTIVDRGGSLFLGEENVGTIDYPSGIFQFNDNTSINTATFKASVDSLQPTESTKIDVIENNRDTTYVLTLDPTPTPKSLSVSYQSQGERYTLRDDGTGALRGISPKHGSGVITEATNTVTINCGELPDVGSSILFSWTTPSSFFNRSGATAEAKMILQLSEEADPSSITLAWLDKTASCDVAGNISGDFTGKYHADTRQIKVDVDADFELPDGVIDIEVTYNAGEKVYLAHKAPLRNLDGTVTLDLGDTAIKPHTYKQKWNLLIEDYDPLKVNEGEMYTRKVDPYKTVHDDGNGNIVDLAGAQVGTIDYANATATFTPDTVVQIPKATYKKIPCGERTVKKSNGLIEVTPLYRALFDKYVYFDAGAAMPIDESALVETWFYDTSPATNKTDNLKSGDIEIDLLKHYAEVISPSSLNFEWQRKKYFDRNGVIFNDLSVSNNAATAVGTIDYQSGIARINVTRFYPNAGDKVVKMKSLATSIDGNPVDSVTFMAPSVPLRPASLQVRAIALDGTKISAKSDASGNIDGQNISGQVDALTGVAFIRFGNLVDAAGNESADWYNADAVDEDGKIWQPTHVFAKSIIYNATAYSYLPVNSDIVKIDTVRLPQDGRVPIFRIGDTILITNKAEDDIGSAHNAGGSVSLSRNDVDRICVVDADDMPVNAELWDYDLDAGSITWRSPLDLSSYKMPLKVKHVQEQRNRIGDIDIDGTLTLEFETNRDYPLEGTFVSSCLVVGDMQVRHSIPFTQKNWDDVWRDEPNGKQLLNKLNLKDYPMVLTDDGAIKDRWMIRMKSANTFELWSEAMGFVMHGDTLQDLAPINPATSKPYFTIPKEAFGVDAPWAMQDVIRFNTWGTLAPVVVLCAQQPTDTLQQGNDGFTQCLFGDTTEII